MGVNGPVEAGADGKAALVVGRIGVRVTVGGLPHAPATSTMTAAMVPTPRGVRRCVGDIGGSLASVRGGVTDRQGRRPALRTSRMLVADGRASHRPLTDRPA